MKERKKKKDKTNSEEKALFAICVFLKFMVMEAKMDLDQSINAGGISRGQQTHFLGLIICTVLTYWEVSSKMLWILTENDLPTQIYTALLLGFNLYGQYRKLYRFS